MARWHQLPWGAGPGTSPELRRSGQVLGFRDDRWEGVATCMTYVVAEPCVDVLDKSCIDECPVDCIYEGERMVYIHPDECIDCAACEPVCPVEAIFYEDDVPEEWDTYTRANAEFFIELGSPGGAGKIGKIDRDVGPATELPPQTP